MPWLVVLGNGSWSVCLAREWVADEHYSAPRDGPLDADGNPQRGRWVYANQTFKAAGSPYEVEQAVVDKVVDVGYDWLIVFDEEPLVNHSAPSGMLTLEDVRVGVSAGARLEAYDSAPIVDESDDGVPQFEHDCKGCSRNFPSSAALERHIEYEHRPKHVEDEEERVTTEEERVAEAEARRRLSQADPDELPPWEKEAAAVD